MRSSTLFLLGILLFWCGPPRVSAQVPRLITVPLYLEESGVPISGSRTVDVRWYQFAVGGAVLLQETANVDFDRGIATLQLGSSVVIPDSLLLSGPLWLGLSIDGATELQPRTMLTSVPYALLSGRARIAEELAPEVTGVVTSLNEIAGAIRLVGGRGVTIIRNGGSLEVNVSRVVESGSIQPATAAHEFAVVPLTILEPDLMIKVDVESNSHIDADVRSIDYITNTIHVATSAPLLSTERLRWTLVR